MVATGPATALIAITLVVLALFTVATVYILPPLLSNDHEETHGDGHGN